ncbi:MAG: DMT family transporter [Alphaproteobacteria bacterium]
MGLTAAFCFSSGTILAPSAFAAGANAQAIVALRLLLICPVIVTYAVLARRPIRLPLRERLIALGLGAFAAFQMLCFYLAVRHIPVSLAILVEYCYPLLVVIAMRVLFREPLTQVKLGAIAAAFLGLFLALRVDFAALNLLGVLFAFGSALGAATKLITSGWFLRSGDPIRLMIHMQFAGILVFWPLFGLTGAFAFPETLGGFAAIAGMAVCNGTGTFLSLAALARIGATRTASAQTAEPIFTVILAVTLLGEVMTFQRALGVALVVGALFALQIWRSRA